MRSRARLIGATVLLQALIIGIGWWQTSRATRESLATHLSDEALPAHAHVESLAREISLYGLGAAGIIVLLSAGGLFLLMRRHDSILVRLNQNLEQEVLRQVRGGLTIRNALIFGLAKLADYRDTDTGKHLERICRYCEILAGELRAEFEEIDEGWIEHLRLAAPMHDIGKVGIPDAILLKPGSLSDRERRLMEQHTLIGADTLVAIRRRVGNDELINMCIQVALYHHERWDGTGYPFGLSGETIPLCARVVALADVYDALTSDRVYKRAMPHQEARGLILANRGTHFDPRVVDAFERAQAALDAARLDLRPEGSDVEKPHLLAAVERAEEARRAGEKRMAA